MTHINAGPLFIPLFYFTFSAKSFVLFVDTSTVYYIWIFNQTAPVYITDTWIFQSITHYWIHTQYMELEDLM
jgi:hypothetical protein